jgi:transmembrane sensor
MLDFDGVTLAEAARTFARYSDQRIVIEDPAVAQRSVTGLFASTDPSGFARAVALSLNLRTRSVGGSIYLSR